jgi:hypothetical protein
MSKPKLQLEKSYGYYHLFIDNMHDPKLCPACIEPGLWPIEAKPEGKPNE